MDIKKIEQARLKKIKREKYIIFFASFILSSIILVLGILIFIDLFEIKTNTQILGSVIFFFECILFYISFGISRR